MRLIPLLLLFACTRPSTLDSVDTGPLDPGPSPYSLDDVLELNHVQAKGTHNSYHLQPETVVSGEHRYTQPPLGEQLEHHGVRQFELDLHYRENVGFQVFHLPSIDPETSCLLFSDCLQILKDWSDVNLWHAPIVVWMEFKDEIDSLDETLLPMEGRQFEVEEAILRVWPRRRILVPDEVRGEHADLATAVETEGWPTLGEVRGQIVFALLEGGVHRDFYVEGAENLEGRLMFVNASAGDPFAAMLKINDGGSVEARDAVSLGYIVTSNEGLVGEDDVAAQAGLDEALGHGVQYISTDFPAPVKDRAFWFEMPEGAPLRCNAVTAPIGCTSAEVEQLQ